MANTPSKPLTDAEQHAAEERARVEALAKEKAETTGKTDAPDSSAEAKTKADAKPTVAKQEPSKASGARARAAKPKDRIEVYEQRGPKGLYKVTRNVDTGESSAELIEE